MSKIKPNNDMMVVTLLITLIHIFILFQSFISAQPKNLRKFPDALGKDKLRIENSKYSKNLDHHHEQQPTTQNLESQKMKPRLPHEVEDYDAEFSFPNTVDLNCHHGKHPVCCSITDNHPSSSSEISPYYPHQYPSPPSSSLISPKNDPFLFCTVTKEYFPSNYEQKHFQKVSHISSFSDREKRRGEYLDFIFEDIPDSIKWIDRVKAHMHRFTDVNFQITADDEYYLSKFKVTRTCRASSSTSASVPPKVETFYEYIEPLTMHGRHPYGIIGCAAKRLIRIDNMIHHKGKTTPIPFNVSKESRDYVLLADGRVPFYNSSFIGRKKPNGEEEIRPMQRYLFDAGSKGFFSSVYWFICGYLQRGLDFDHIYAWESDVMKIQGDKYWDDVPKKISPFLHFYNNGVSSVNEQLHSVIRVIKQLATSNDFVSFKLDIDTPNIEIPIAMQILKDPSVTALVDEFFFELHYHCEFMMNCGWGNSFAHYIEGLTLDRISAMKFFQDFRKAGIRSHYWP